MADRLRVFVLVGVLALATAAPAVAAPPPLSPRGMRVQQLELAASGARTGIVMAGYEGTTRKLRWKLLVKLGDRPLQRLEGSAFGPRIAVGRDGTAVVVWVVGRSLRAAIAPPGHGFGPPQTLATAPADVPAGTGGIVPGGVAVGRNGAAIVAWRHGNAPTATVRVAFRHGNGFAAPQTLGESFYAPAVASAGGDAFAVAWESLAHMPPPGVPPTPEGNPRIMLAVASTGASAFGAPTVLAGPPTILSTPPSAFSGPGGAAVAWQEMAARRIALVARSGAVELTDLGPGRSNDAGYDEGASVAVASGGDVAAVWRFVAMSAGRIVGAQVLAAERSPGGAFAFPKTLSLTDRFAGTPAVTAVGARTLAAWSERDPRGGGTRLRLRALDSGAAVTLATADGGGLVRLASAGRSAVVAWVARAGRGRGRVRVYDVAR